MSKARGPYRVDPLGYKKKAMKQAMEALKESIDVPCYGGHPKQEAAYHALQKALANEALDKKAENARELGLDYESAQQEPKLSEIFCGVDFADGMLSVCVLRRRADDVAELLHVEHIALQAQQGLSDLDVWKVRALQAEAVIAKFMSEPAAQPKYRRGDRLICLETEEYCVIHISGTDRQWVKFPDTHVGVYKNEQLAELFELLPKEIEIEQPAQQEPMAWLSTDSIGERYLCFDKPLDNDSLQSLYTSPPAQRTWVGLTDEEVESVWKQVEVSDFHDCVQPFARAIEAALRSKNT